jgi:RNA-directed DNA polymerase
MQLKLYTESKDDRKKKFSSLKRLLLNDEVLYAAWSDVKRNTRAAGADSLTVAKVEEEGIIDFLKTIKTELKHNLYRADMVRGIKIPRPDGRERHLGILTVKDRVAQAAVKLIIEPIFEADFDETSFGFRAFRSTRLASLEAYKWLEAGNDYVFKADIEKCFDSIPHSRLLACLENRINDRYLLSIIESWLGAGIMEVGHVDYPEKGVLQGGIISPLLVNIYLDQFDNKWLEIGLKSQDDDFRGHLVRYADDFVILSRNRIDFEYVQGILAELELGLNKNKTMIVRARDGFEFLGFYFVETFPDSKYQSKIRIYPTEGSIERVIGHIQSAAELKPGNNPAPGAVIQEIMKVVDPWINYYQHTDYLAGMERIQRCFNECVQGYIEGVQKTDEQNLQKDFQSYLTDKVKENECVVRVI